MIPDKKKIAIDRIYSIANSGSLYFRSTFVIPGGIYNIKRVNNKYLSKKRKKDFILQKQKWVIKIQITGL